MSIESIAVTVTSGTEKDLISRGLIDSKTIIQIHEVMAFNESDTNSTLEILDGPGGTILFHVGLPTGYEPQRDKDIDARTTRGNVPRIKGSTSGKTLRAFVRYERL